MLSRGSMQRPARSAGLWVRGRTSCSASATLIVDAEAVICLRAARATTRELRRPVQTASMWGGPGSSCRALCALGIDQEWSKAQCRGAPCPMRDVRTSGGSGAGGARAAPGRRANASLSRLLPGSQLKPSLTSSTSRLPHTSSNLCRWLGAPLRLNLGPAPSCAPQKALEQQQ